MSITVENATTVKAIKLGGNYALSVLAAPYGGPHDRDSDGEWFSQKTKFHLDRYTPSPIYYHGFTKNKQLASEPVFLGQTIKHNADSQGVWLTVELDMDTPEAEEVWTAAKSGNAAASSGSIKHLVRKTKDGEILQWPMAEISLWERTPDRPQSNKRATALPALKAAGINVPDELVLYCESEDRAIEVTGQSPSADGDSSSHILPIKIKDNQTMEDDVKDKETVLTPAMIKMVQDSIAAELAKKEAEEKAVRDAEEAQETALKAALDAQATALKEAHDAELKKAKEEAVLSRRLPFGDAPNQAQFGNISRFDNVSPDDLAFAHGVMKAAGIQPSEDLTKYVAINFMESSDANHNAAKAAMKMAGMGAMKADELNQSTLASFGDEWVGQAYSSQVWEKVRLETQIVAQLPSQVIPQGNESITIPFDSSSATFYKVAQASAQDSNPGRITQTFTSSKVGTGNRVLNSQKIGAFVPWAQELTEDSIVNWIGFLRMDLMKEYAEVLEHCVIDGDTAAGATANVNDIAGTPAGTEPFMMFDGFRKLALVTNTANSRDGGALAATDYIDTVSMLGTAGVNGWDKSKVFMTTDINTAYATLKLSSLETRDTISAPTIESGRITQLYGYNIMPSANMHRAQPNRLANSAGKVDLDTAGNNTTGAILAVRADQWMFGFKRAVTFEVQRDAGSDANEIYMHSRVGLLNRDSEASAISYNITV